MVTSRPCRPNTRTVSFSSTQHRTPERPTQQDTLLVAVSPSWYSHGMTEEHPKRRRWLQFRLRTLLIAILVLSLPLSWLGVRLQRVRQQRETRDVIHLLGGRVFYDWELRFSDIVRPQDVRKRWLMNLPGADIFAEVAMVDLNHTSVTDADLKQLCGVTSLKCLWLCNTQITDAGLEHLKGLDNLVIVQLHSTQVTPEGVKDLQKALPDCTIGYETIVPVFYGETPQLLSR